MKTRSPNSPRHFFLNLVSRLIDTKSLRFVTDGVAWIFSFAKNSWSFHERVHEWVHELRLFWLLYKISFLEWCIFVYLFIIPYYRYDKTQPHFRVFPEYFYNRYIYSCMACENQTGDEPSRIEYSYILAYDHSSCEYMVAMGIRCMSW